MIENFKDEKRNVLTVVTRKHAIFLARPLSENSDMKFDKETWNNLKEFLSEQANQCWKNFQPKESTNRGSDYSEYYDRELDSNGYLSIGDCTLSISRPVNEELRCYKFDKTKMQSFMFDLLNRIGD